MAADRPAAPAAAAYDKPLAMADVVLLTLKDGQLCVFLARRGFDDDKPNPGALALPGGYIHVDEDADAEATARRVLRDKVGLVAPYLEQLYTFSGRQRDPRGWSLSVAYFALVPLPDLTIPAGIDAEVRPVGNRLPLPFDHNAMVDLAVKRLRGKSEYSSLPFYLLPDEFTLGELQDVYEQVLGEKQNTMVFRRKMLDRGMIAPIPGRTSQKNSPRPAQVYKRSADGLVLMKTPI